MDEYLHSLVAVMLCSISVTFTCVVPNVQFFHHRLVHYYIPVKSYIVLVTPDAT